MADDSYSGVIGASGPRLCHVVKVDDFDGYGFNLLAEQGKPGQFIGKVDEGSPAEKAGLRTGDKILEVNGVSIVNDNHKQVVQKIKAVSGETKLLVISPLPDERVPQIKQEEERIEIKAPEIRKESEKSDISEKSETNNHIMTDTSKLNLGMSAAEMRAKLAAKKKTDPKKIQLDFKSKFEIVKQL